MHLALDGQWGALAVTKLILHSYISRNGTSNLVFDIARL